MNGYVKGLGEDKNIESTMALIKGNKNCFCGFLPAKLDGGFNRWVEKGLTTVNQLFEGTTLKTFSQRQTQYGITPNDPFRYFQIQHYPGAQGLGQN